MNINTVGGYRESVEAFIEMSRRVAKEGIEVPKEAIIAARETLVKYAKYPSFFNILSQEIERDDHSK